MPIRDIPSRCYREMNIFFPLENFHFSISLRRIYPHDFWPGLGVKKIKKISLKKIPIHDNPSRFFTEMNIFSPLKIFIFSTSSGKIILTILQRV